MVVDIPNGPSRWWLDGISQNGSAAQQAAAGLETSRNSRKSTDSNESLLFVLNELQPFLIIDNYRSDGGAGLWNSTILGRGVRGKQRRSRCSGGATQNGKR